MKADGRMFTRLRTIAGTWETHERQGTKGWTNVDVAIAAEGDLWLTALKKNGRLFSRHNSGPEWTRFELHGAPTWSTDTPPSMAAGGGGVIYTALKEDGRLCTRAQPGGNDWQPFVQHGRGSWSGGAVEMNESGQAALVAVKQSGTLYTRTDQAGWGAWTQHGRSNWSANTSPAVATSDDGSLLLAVKESGQLFTRTFE